MSTLVGELQIDVTNGQAKFVVDDALSQLDKLGKGAEDASGRINYSMREARESVLLTTDAFGVHLPGGIARAISSIAPLGPALEAAMPVAAIAAGAILLVEHIHKVREEAEKLVQAQANFGTTSQNVFNNLNDKLLEAEKRADELRGDHLSALQKELELIDHTSLKELAQEFEILDKAAEQVFANLKVSWYQLGSGSAGAKHALEDFKAHYDALIATGKDKEASDLLAGTLNSAKQVLAIQQDLKSKYSAKAISFGDFQTKDQSEVNALKQAGVGISDKEVEAQKTLVDTLQNLVSVYQRINSLKNQESANAETSTYKQIAQAIDQRAAAERKFYDERQKRQKEDAKKAQEAADEIAQAQLKATEAVNRLGVEQQEALDAERIAHTERMAKLNLAAETEAAKHSLAMKRSTFQQALDAQIAAENQSYKVDQDSLEAQIGNLDKNEKNYQAKLQGLYDKEQELTKQHENKLTQIRDRAEEERNRSILAAEERLVSELSSSIAQTLVMNKNLGQAMRQIGEQMLEGVISNTLKMIAMNNYEQFSEAKIAAARTYASISGIPYVGPFLAPELAAAAFAAVMAFNEGGIVPGYGNGDSVPAILTPGETVLPQPISQGLQNVIASGDVSGSKGDTHVNAHFAPTIHALDAEGVDRVLTKHADRFHKALVAQARKRNLH
jgi:hypothetical protein